MSEAWHSRQHTSLTKPKVPGSIPGRIKKLYTLAPVSEDNREYFAKRSL